MTMQVAPKTSVAIMQPYVFPYLGYYQLAHTADHFVFYDDVQFMKGGWVNRNRISNQGKPLIFTIPARGVSSSARIMDIGCGVDAKFQKKFLRQLEQEYRKAPHVEAVVDLVAKTLSGPHEGNMSKLAIASVRNVFDYLDLPLSDQVSSLDHPRADIKGSERVIAVTKALGGQRYVNLPGGVSLYSTDEFAQSGIDLKFIQDQSAPYTQFNHPFIPRLSIIDVMMHNSPDRLRVMLDQVALRSADDMGTPESDD